MLKAHHQHAWQHIGRLADPPLNWEWCQLCGSFAYWARGRKQRRRAIHHPLYWTQLLKGRSVPVPTPPGAAEPLMNR